MPWKLADMLKQREDEVFELKDIVRRKATSALSDVETALSDLNMRAETDKATRPKQA